MSRPVVVFEGPVDCAHWGKLSELSTFSRPISYDRGLLGSRGRWSFPDMAGRLVALLPPEPVILTGHSLTGLLVQYVASRHPDRVAGLVLIDPTPHQLPPLPLAVRAAAPLQSWGMLALAEVAVRLRLLANPAWTSLTERLLIAPLGPHADTGQVEGIRARSKDPIQVGRNARAACAIARRLGEYGELTSRQLHQHGLPDVPLVVLTAGRRPAATGKMAAFFEQVRTHHERLATLVPGGRCDVVESSGHMIPIEAPDALIRTIRRLQR